MIDNEEELREKVISLLKMIYDPEIPVDIYLLGLIYKIEFSKVRDNIRCNIEMTLTSPACPVADTLIEQVYNICLILDEIDEMKVDVVFDPPWGPDMMSDEARLELDMFS